MVAAWFSTSVCSLERMVEKRSVPSQEFSFTRNKSAAS